jgi:hypothetical protein
MEAESDGMREEARGILQDGITRELENSQRLLELLEGEIEFMATTDRDETPLIHGTNLRESVKKRMGLMEAHRNDDPYIDPEYMERQAGQPV